MALNNCTISNTSVEATSGATDITNQVLYIIPDLGFTVSAIDFSVDNISYAGNVNSLVWTDGVNSVALPNTGVVGDTIDTITLSNTSSAHVIGNKVKVEVNLDNAYSISSDTSLVIDIDGDARDENLITVKPVLVQGSYFLAGGDYGDYADCEITVTGYNGFTVTEVAHSAVNNNDSTSHLHWTFNGDITSGVSTKVGTVLIERAAGVVLTRNISSGNIYSQGPSWSVGHSKFEALNNVITTDSATGWGESVTFDLYFTDTTNTISSYDIEDMATSLTTTFRVMSAVVGDTNPSVDDIVIEDLGTGDTNYVGPEETELEVTLTSSIGTATGDDVTVVTVEMFNGLGSLDSIEATLSADLSTYEPNTSYTYSTTSSGGGVGAEITITVDASGNISNVAISDVGLNYVVGETLTISTLISGQPTPGSETSPIGETVDVVTLNPFGPTGVVGIDPSSGNGTNTGLSPSEKYPPISGSNTSGTTTIEFPCPALPDKASKGYLLVVTSTGNSTISGSAKRNVGSKVNTATVANKIFIPVYQYANPAIGLKATATGAIALGATGNFTFLSSSNVVGTSSSATATTFNGTPNSSGDSSAWMNGNLVTQDFVFSLKDTTSFNLVKDATSSDFAVDASGSGNDVTFSNIVTTIDNVGSIRHAEVSGTILYNEFGTSDVSYTLDFNDIFTTART